jgi:poly-gamma-glutamate synthesis protein (capsule biosynthesis protein)
VDLAVGNLEGPITQKESVSLGSEFASRENYVFTFPPKAAGILYGKNIRLVNIGNNHILNFQEGGLSETKENLTLAAVEFFGNPGKGESKFFSKEIGGLKIAFVNYNQFAKNGETQAFSDLESAKNLSPDFLVVYTHWGTEFQKEPGEKIKKLGRKFIDSGADLVIGSHPHVRQGKEEYEGKMIYYSLGNFIFDQYFDPETQKGLVIEMKLKKGEAPVFQEYGVEMKTDGRTVLD